MVETFFAQMCDQFHLKRNYAKSYDGLLARLASKLSSMSILLHWLNHLNGKNYLKSNTLCVFNSTTRYFLITHSPSSPSKTKYYA